MSLEHNGTASHPSLTVAKFGGTSVADHHAMQLSALVVKNNPATKVVLISACSGVTNILVELAIYHFENNV